MKFKLENKYFRWGLTAFLVIAASIIFYYVVFYGSDIKVGIMVVTNILMPVVFGLVTAYLLTPVLNFIENKILLPLCDKCRLHASPKRNSVVRGAGIFLTFLLLFALIYNLFGMLLSQIVPSIQNIVLNFDYYINNFIRWLNRFLEDNVELKNYATRMVNTYSADVEAWLNNTLFTTTSELVRRVSLSVIGVLKVLWNFIIGLIISVYVLAGKEKFAGQAKKITYALFEKNTANIIIRNFRFTHRTFIGFIGGKIVDSLIIGILCFIGTAVLHTPYGALVSVIVGVTNVIPFFGPYLGAIPSIILIFVVDPAHPLNCAYFVVFIVILQQFDGNFLGPKILGNSTGLTGFWVIFAITLFGGLFGVPGMIVGIPVFAVMYAAIKSMVNAALTKKNMPYETQKYMRVEKIDEQGFHDFVQRPAERKKWARMGKRKENYKETGKRAETNSRQNEERED
mgnify:CR=1 FL=1